MLVNFYNMYIFLSVICLTDFTSQCQDATRIIARVTDTPILQFDYTDYTDKLVRVRRYSGDIFDVDYIGDSTSTPDLNGCEIATGTDLNNGVLHLQLDPITVNQAGVYELLIIDTRRSCLTLFILGKIIL